MIKVGCAGFPTSMERYFGNFRLVELNSTFYQYPREKTVEGWREKAPKDFEFTVKAHQDISHKAKLKAEETSLQAFERMKQICKTLNSKILLIQTSGSLRLDKLADAQKFFREAKRENLVWFGKPADQLGKPQKLTRSLEKFCKNWMLRMLLTRLELCQPTRAEQPTLGFTVWASGCTITSTVT